MRETMRSMSKMGKAGFLLGSSWCVFCFVCCTKVTNTSKEATQSPVPVDYFDKKLKCETFLEKRKTRLEKESREAIASAVYNQSENYTTSFVGSVCYSKKYNTCVGFIVATTRQGIRLGKRVLEESFDATD